MIYIYIYAFSRRFYPKRLTIAFRLYIFISMCSLGIEPTTFCAADAMLYHWATQEHIYIQNSELISHDSMFMELWDKTANTFCLTIFLIPCQKQASVLTWTAHTSCHWSLHMSIRSCLSGRCLTRTICFSETQGRLSSFDRLDSSLWYQVLSS